MRNALKLTTKFVAVIVICVMLGTLLASSLTASALSSNDFATDTPATSPTTPNCSSEGTGTKYQQHLQDIITKGNAEINRRLTTLSTLTSKISSATKLTSSDAASLGSEVSSTISGLTSLETQLGAETNICNALTDRSNIYSEYRVYALVAPKVQLIKVADDQQAIEANLLTLSTKLQTRITNDQNANKDVAALQTDLNNMISEIKAAEAISNQIETDVINLLPSDYNSNHEVLLGDSTQLKTARADLQSAYQNAKTIVAGLKSLETPATSTSGGSKTN